jgi:hypothetical protein
VLAGVLVKRAAGSDEEFKDDEEQILYTLERTTRVLPSP